MRSRRGSSRSTPREQTSTLEVILGARSLDDMINRLDNAKSVTNLDADVLGQVKTFRAAVQRNRAQLDDMPSRRQQRVVAQRAAAKQAIASKLAQQQSLLASIKGQIASMIAAEQARQLQMAQAAQAAPTPHAARSSRKRPTPSSGSRPRRRSSTPSWRRRRASRAAVGVAMSQLGKPYVWAAAGPDSFDCSGLVVYSFAAVGKSLPHSTYALYSMGAPVSRDQLEPGDLVFFDGLGHVGIYIGGGQFVHAPHTGDVVKVSNLDEGWYASSYVGARRIL